MIVEGSSTLNTSALTGESVPRDAKCGDEIISGCINMSGVLKIKTTKEFGESTVSKILDLVENSSSKKSKSENFIQNLPNIILRQSATVHLHLRYCRRLSEYFSCQLNHSGAYGYTGHLHSS